jgi:hypothetical protein
LIRARGDEGSEEEVEVRERGDKGTVTRPLSLRGLQALQKEGGTSLVAVEGRLDTGEACKDDRQAGKEGEEETVAISPSLYSYVASNHPSHTDVTPASVCDPSAPVLVVLPLDLDFPVLVDLGYDR